MTYQLLIILDGPLQDQENFLVDDRLMMLYNHIKVPEIEITFHGERQRMKKSETGKYFIYQITQEGLKYVD